MLKFTPRMRGVVRQLTGLSAAALGSGGVAWAAQDVPVELAPGVLAGLAFSVLVPVAVLAYVAWRALRGPRRAASPRFEARLGDYDPTQLGQEAFAPLQGLGVAADRREPAADAPERAAVVAQARSLYLRLRPALDAGDLQILRAHVTTELLEQLSGRDASPPDSATTAASASEIVTMQAILLDLSHKGGVWHANVEFSGLVREPRWGGAQPVREVWDLVLSGEPRTWLLAAAEELD